MDLRKQLVLAAFTQAITRKTNSAQRLQNGLNLRHQFEDSLRHGVIPTHPRFMWLRKAARALLEHLLTVAKEYDKTNSDKASMPDLLDIVQMTTGHIQNICKQGVLDPDDVQLIPFAEVVPEFTEEDQDDEEDDEDDEDT